MTGLWRTSSTEKHGYSDQREPDGHHNQAGYQAVGAGVLRPLLADNEEHCDQEDVGDTQRLGWF